MKAPLSVLSELASPFKKSSEGGGGEGGTVGNPVFGQVVAFYESFKLYVGSF